MLIGYARVSTHEQNLALQQDALNAAGCERILADEASGAAESRPELERALDILRPGDTLGLTLRLDAAAHVYVLNEDRQGEGFVLGVGME